MFIVWLAIMGLIVGGTTAFLIGRIDSESGPPSKRRNLLFIASMTLLGGIVFSVLLGWLGYLVLGESGTLLVGLIGGIIVVLAVWAWSVRSTQTRANKGRGLAPTRSPEGEAATKTPTPQ